MEVKGIVLKTKTEAELASGILFKDGLIIPILYENGTMKLAVGTGDTVSSYKLVGGGDVTDKSADFTGNVFNSNALNITNGKLIVTNGIINFIFKGAERVAITNLQSASRKILELPELPTGITYPSEFYINIKEPTGTYTCTEDKNEFWVSGGASYVTEAEAKAHTFSYKTYKRYYTYKKTTDTAIQPTKTYYIQTQTDEAYDTYEVVTSPVVADISKYYEQFPTYIRTYTKTTDTSIVSGKTYYTKSIDEGNNTYYTKVTSPVASDLSKYYEGSLTEVIVGWVQETKTITGDGTAIAYVIDFNKGKRGMFDYNETPLLDSTGAEYKCPSQGFGSMSYLSSVSLAFDSEFVRKTLTIDKGCYVDENAKVGKFTITKNANFNKLQIVDTTTGTKANYGFSGTITFAEKNHTGNEGQVKATINASREVSVAGNIAISELSYRGLL